MQGSISASTIRIEHRHCLLELPLTNVRGDRPPPIHRRPRPPSIPTAHHLTTPPPYPPPTSQLDAGRDEALAVRLLHERFPEVKPVKKDKDESARKFQLARLNMVGKANSAGTKSTLKARPSVYSGKANHGHGHGHGDGHGQQHHTTAALVPQPARNSEPGLTSDRSRSTGGWGVGTLEDENEARRSSGLQMHVMTQGMDRWTSQGPSHVPALERATLDVLTVRGVPVIAVAKAVKGFDLAQR